MEPKYSVLYFDNQLNTEVYADISRYLKKGIKVLWFGNMNDVERLKQDFEKFSKAFFLQAFDISDCRDKTSLGRCCIVDGAEIEGDSDHAKLLSFLEDNVPRFNTAQYRVEHCLESSNIVVKASAGTGKTTVMVDRILYLMHMVENLEMSDIYMITFTNEATNQMNERLQNMLLKKYALTKNKRYLAWLEQQSQMHISTIDSLAYDLFKSFGASVGFGRDLAIQPLEKERKDIIRDLLSEQLSASKPISEQIGMSYAAASNLVDKYWKEITRKGYTISQILDMQWGDNGEEPVIQNFQTIIKKVLAEFEPQYRQLKLDSNAISINDLFFDFGHFLLDDHIDCEGLKMKYLFVDEFQDTDATQIRTFARLVQTIDARLFAVGDVKQSIYGFKGATDEAFDILESSMEKDIRYFSLLNNYRTCGNIMEAMEDYFYEWSRQGLLRYEESVRPFNTQVGRLHMEYLQSKDTQQSQAVLAISNALQNLEIDVRSGKKNPEDSKTRVAVLVRGNNKASEVASWCRDNGMTVVLNSDKPFFLSEAVRDFYAMISSYIFVKQPIYTYNYLMTPYASFEDEISISELELLQGNQKELNTKLGVCLKETSWYKYQADFRTRPILSVIKDMLADTNINIIDNYIQVDKCRMFGEKWTVAGRNKQAMIDARQYKANLDKLMDMLQQRMDGEFATLYDLYVYLTLMIATNREDMEPDIEMNNDYTSVYVMTVHKSKGLEFDSVIMPCMNSNIEPNKRTEILVNKDKVGWCYKPEGTDLTYMKNALYDDLYRAQVIKNVAEETRLLYVGMTRAVNNLSMILNSWDMYKSWSTLIRKVGLINE